MTIDISDNDPRISYTANANGAQTVFAVPFEFFDNSDLKVYVAGVLKSEGTGSANYSVSGGSGSTGTVTFVSGVTASATVVITRSITIERVTDFTAGADINRAALNTQLDTLTAIAADLKDLADRSIILSDFDTSVSTTLPLVDDRKGKTLTFNSSTGAVEAGEFTATNNFTVSNNLTVSGATDVDSLEFNSLSGTGSVSVTDIADEDNMSSNSATKLATQQSIKAYVDAQVDTVDTLSEVLALGNTTGGTDVSVSTDDKVQFRDTAIYINSSADGQLDIVADTEIQIAATTIDINGAVALNGAITGATNISLSGTVDGRDVATDGSKLDGIEASADVTDATNVTAAGALMDSEVTNLSEVKAFASSDYATAAQGTLATNAMPKSGGAFTGAVTTNSTFDGVDIATRDGVLTSTTTTANAALPKAGGTMTGALKTLTLQETYVANSTGATTTLDLSTGTSFSVTLSENTTFAFTLPTLPSDTAFSFTLFITQPSSAKTIAWPSSVDWAGGSAPAAPENSEVNAYGFYTRDGGTTYYGFLGGVALG